MAGNAGKEGPAWGCRQRGSPQLPRCALELLCAGWSRPGYRQCSEAAGDLLSRTSPCQCLQLWVWLQPDLKWLVPTQGTFTSSKRPLL